MIHGFDKHEFIVYIHEAILPTLADFTETRELKQQADRLVLEDNENYQRNMLVKSLLRDNLKEITWHVMAVITKMENSGESGRFYAKNGNIIIKNDGSSVYTLTSPLRLSLRREIKFKWMLVHGMMEK